MLVPHRCDFEIRLASAGEELLELILGRRLRPFAERLQGGRPDIRARRRADAVPHRRADPRIVE